jgi:putative intracellular protease/amidase/YHS domain-containing protein
VLKGLDPILLLKGKEVKGEEARSKQFGKFKYLFANADDEAAFATDPSRYAVQNDGACLMMPDMEGDPNLFLVYAGKIYLAGNTTCLAAVKADPLAYIHPGSSAGTVAILLFPGAEIIDYAGPWEVLGEAGYKVVTVAQKSGPVHAGMGQVLTPDYTFENCPPVDVLILPGGAVPKLEKTDAVSQWIIKKASETTNTMSVCNGVYWLANAGLLDGKSATTIHGELANLESSYPQIHVVSDQRFVDNGSIITTAGLSAGIDGAFHLVDKLQGAAQARSIALGMEYNWQANQHYARGTFPDKYLAKLGHIGLPEGATVEDLANEGDADHWELAGRITFRAASADKAVPQILKIIEDRFTAAGWSRSSIPDSPTSTTWTFKGDNGQAWNAILTVEAEKGKKGQYLEKIEIVKA